MGERTSRDANDPRDQLRAMNKEARAEMEEDEIGQTGGQERAQRVPKDKGGAAPPRGDAPPARGEERSAGPAANRPGAPRQK